MGSIVNLCTIFRSARDRGSGKVFRPWKRERGLAYERTSLRKIPEKARIGKGAGKKETYLP